MPLNSRNLRKVIGPGLLFASAAIGTSHLVLSTRAGAHHGMIYFWIIVIAMILKYPFYEIGPRYANATGYSLLKGYKDQGAWSVILFICIITISMFAVTGAIAAVSAGLLATMFGIKSIPVPVIAGIVIAVTVFILLIGGFKILDKCIKGICLILLTSVLIAFIAALFNGPVTPIDTFESPPLFEGAGLALLVGLLGWMPAGMEASTMNSIWTVEKVRSTNYSPTLRESLFDFNLGYFLTLVLALLFLTIGAYTSYGTGATLDGNATQFSNKLLAIFTSNLGGWSYYIIAIAALGAIYGTLITVLDAFPRCFVRSIRVLKYDETIQNETQITFLEKFYKIMVIIVGCGGFALFYFSATSMIQLLNIVTILSFLTSPVIAFINLRAIQSEQISESHRLQTPMLILSYLGLMTMVGSLFSAMRILNYYEGRSKGKLGFMTKDYRMVLFAIR